MELISNSESDFLSLYLCNYEREDIFFHLNHVAKSVNNCVLLTTVDINVVEIAVGNKLELEMNELLVEFGS